MTAGEVLAVLLQAWQEDINSVSFPLFDHLPAVLEGQTP